MMTAPLPHDEAHRLRSLESLDIIREAANARVERLVAIAKQAFRVQHALVSLVGADTQRFWCQQGPTLADTPRHIAFCAHTILADAVMWVDDARRDPRFADNPLVLGEPHIAFYAGVSVHAPDGARVGSLCVFDPQPRALDRDQAGMLADLAACVDEEFKRRDEQQLKRQLARERQRLAQIIDATRVGTWEWNVQTGESHLGAHWGATLGHRIDTRLPRRYETWSDLVHADDLPRAREGLEACLRGDTVDYVCEYRMRHADGGWRWMLDRGQVVARDEQGQPTWMAGTHSDITERKQLELALGAQAEFLRQIIDTSPSALLVCDAQGRVQFRNHAARQLLLQLGGSETTAANAGRWVLPAFLAIDGAPLAPATQPITEALEQNRRIGAQRLALGDKEGTLLQLLVDAAPLGAEGSSERTVLLSLLDVSMQVQRERQIDWEQQRFRSLVDSVQGIVWEADVETGTFRYVSGQAERLLGYPLGEWFTPGFWPAHIHPDDRERALSYCQTETAARRNHTFDYRMLGQDGRVVWLRDYVSVVSDAAGAPSLRGIMIDVSAEYATEAELREARSMLRLALRAAGIGTWEVDLASGGQRWDAQMWRLLGLAEANGDEACELAMASLGLQGFVDASATHADEAALQATRTVRRVDSHEERQLHVSATRVRAADGSDRLVGTAWDCTAYVQRESALRERQEALQQMVEAQTLSAVQARHRAERAAALQSEFLANVSHELRTPLHAILGFLGLARDELAEDAGLDTAQLQKRIDKAHSAAGRLLGLVDDLLDLAKLESGHSTLVLAPLDLESVLDAVIDELQPLHAARGLRVLREQADPTPPVLADSQRIGQVFRNVLANASRFSPERGIITLALSASSEDGEHWIDVGVRDQGPGIPPGEEEQIFDKFVQSSRSVQGRASGTGLGLPIAREIMRAHGGDIRAERHEGGGALFRIRFPQAGDRDIEALR